jgi:hypothetical protein
LDSLSTAGLSTDRFIDSQFIGRPFHRNSLSTLPLNRQVHFIDNSIFIKYFTLAWVKIIFETLYIDVFGPVSSNMKEFFVGHK